MAKLQVFKYKEQEISFDFGDGNRMVNATEMAKVFNKKVNNFLRQKSTEAYIKALTEYLLKKKGKSETLISVSLQEQIIRIVKGNFSNGHLQGTWMHRILALRFAQWLNPKFAIWVDEKIQELLHQGYTSIHPLKSITYIYFVKSVELNRVKIGMSRNVYQRLADLRISSADKLEVLKIIRANPTYPTDRAVHVLFPHLCVHGEWFRLTKELQSFIDQLETLPSQQEIYQYERRIAELTEDIETQKQKLFRKEGLIENLLKELGDLQKDYQKLKNTLVSPKPLPPQSPKTVAPSSHAETYPQKIYVPNSSGDEWLQIDLQEILYFKAHKKGVLLFVVDGNGKNYYVPWSFQDFITELPSQFFAPIHRGYAINLMHLKAIHPKKSKTVLTGNVVLPISRRKIENFQQQLKVFVKRPVH
ncbi:MAG: KilA-N domain-containing protein [Chitinophagales bacterium]